MDSSDLYSDQFFVERRFMVVRVLDADNNRCTSGQCSWFSTVVRRQHEPVRAWVQM